MFDVDGYVVDGEDKVGGEVEVFVFVFEDIDGSDLCVNEFVAELREEKLRILFAHVVEMFAYFSI